MDAPAAESRLDAPADEARESRQSPAGLIAAATRGNKKTNQDAIGLHRGKRLRVVAIADGVGSAVDSHLASRLAVDAVIRQLSAFDRSITPLSGIEGAIRSAWDAAFAAIDGTFETQKAVYERHEGAPVLQTTLLLAVDVGDRYLVSYIGNGAALYVRGDLTRFTNRPITWAIANLTAGHAVPGQLTGKDELSEVIQPGRRGEVVELTHSKNRKLGDLLLLCTDGVYSEEQARIGVDDQQKAWVEINPLLRQLIQSSLSGFINQGRLGDGDSALQRVLEDFLERQTFDDDASVAVMVSEQVRAV